MKIKKSALKEAVKSEVISQLRELHAKRENLNEVAQILQRITKKNRLK